MALTIVDCWTDPRILVEAKAGFEDGDVRGPKQ